MGTHVNSTIPRSRNREFLSIRLNEATTRWTKRRKAMMTMKLRYKNLATSAILCVLLVMPGLAVATPVAGVSFTATGSEGHRDCKSRMMGWQFTVGTDHIEVTELGYQDFGLDGLVHSHEVGIWQLSDEVLMGSVVVPEGVTASLDGFFRYAPLASPFTLISGTTYLISGFDSGYDPSVWDEEIQGGFSLGGSYHNYNNMDVTGFYVDPAITIGDPGTAHGPWQSNFGFPVSTEIGGSDPRRALMGPNLKFSVVPEPATMLLLGSGLIGLAGFRRRFRKR